MKIFVESIDKEIWDAIQNGPFAPMLENDKVVSKKPWSQWTEHESKNMRCLGCRKGKQLLKYKRSLPILSTTS